MYLTIKQQVKRLSKEDYLIMKELCHTAKNLANEAIYNVRQYYFTEGAYSAKTEHSLRMSGALFR